MTKRSIPVRFDDDIIERIDRYIVKHKRQSKGSTVSRSSVIRALCIAALPKFERARSR